MRRKHTAARGQHNRAKLRRLNERLQLLGLPSVPTLTQGRKERKARNLLARIQAEQQAVEQPTGAVATPIDEKRAKYEAKKAKRKAQAERAKNRRDERHSANKQLSKAADA